IGYSTGNARGSAPFTHEKYTRALTGWYARNHGLVRCRVLVLQADSKAYAEDEHLLNGLRSLADKPVVIVLNQVDNLPPVDDALTARSWRSGFSHGSAKGASIREGIFPHRESVQSPGGGCHATHCQGRERLQPL